MFLNVFLCKIITNKILDNSLFCRLLYIIVFLCRINSIDDMLLYQGVLAFEYFTKQEANQETIETMRKALKE